MILYVYLDYFWMKISNLYLDLKKVSEHHTKRREILLTVPILSENKVATCVRLFHDFRFCVFVFLSNRLYSYCLEFFSIFFLHENFANDKKERLVAKTKNIPFLTFSRTIKNTF